MVPLDEAGVKGQRLVRVDPKNLDPQDGCPVCRAVHARVLLWPYVVAKATSSKGGSDVLLLGAAATPPMWKAHNDDRKYPRDDIIIQVINS